MGTKILYVNLLEHESKYVSRRYSYQKQKMKGIRLRLPSQSKYRSS